MMKFGLLREDENINKIKTVLASIKELTLVEDIPHEQFDFKIDAIQISFSGIPSIALINNYLKNFKHVFLSNSHKLDFIDFQKIVKISEESNVRFYTDFESPASFIKQNIVNDLSGDIQLIEIKHKIQAIGLLTDTSFLKKQILCNIDIALSVSKANVKKVSAYIWPLFNEENAVVKINLEFDNNSVASIVILNDSYDNLQNIEMYTKSEIVSIVKNENVLNVTHSTNNSSNTTFNKDVDDSTYLKSNINSFLAALDGVLPGIIDIDNKYNAIRICNIVCSKLMCFNSNIFF